ncbi:MAG: helix-turn-helix domain-containing protein [bacterium]
MDEVRIGAPTEFRQALLVRLLSFLWRQWSSLGVLGESGSEDEWVIDPEALLVFSLEMARYEPRLFDEILAWLVVNGDRLDTARMKNLVAKQGVAAARVVGGALQWSADKKKEHERKWRSILEQCGTMCALKASKDSADILFREKSGKPHPRSGGDRRDASFALFHVDRPRVGGLKEAKAVPVNGRANLRFLLRPLFGSGAKSEAILYLLTHEGGGPRDIAESVGLYWLSMQQALQELSRSGLVLTRYKGKRLEYYLFQKKWWEFLAAADYEAGGAPRWLDWVAIFAALSAGWRAVDELAESGESDYMKSSRLRDSFEVLGREFARAGCDVSGMPRAGLPGDLYQKMSLRFLGDVFAVSGE